MSTVKPDLDEPGYWTEEAYLSLGETKTKIELIDGGLWVSPSNGNAHNHILANLIPVMKRAARTAELDAVLVPNVRLGPSRILIPDIAVGHFMRTTAMNPASEAVLVVEITSPGNAAVDRTLKKKLYAEAMIDWYLLVEPDFSDYESLSLLLLRRDGGEYVAHAEARSGDTLTSTDPFPLEIDTMALLDF
jgi:Uma2 family endonuclease